MQQAQVPPRETKSGQVAVRLEPAVIDRLNSIAAAEGRTLANVVRELLVDKIDERLPRLFPRAAQSQGRAA